MAGPEVTLHGRFWVTPEATGSVALPAVGYIYGGHCASSTDGTLTHWNIS